MNYPYDNPTTAGRALPPPPPPLVTSGVPWYRRKLVWAGVVAVLLIGAAAAGGANAADDGGSGGATLALDDQSTTTSERDEAEPPPGEPITTTTAPPEPVGPETVPLGTPVPFTIEDTFLGDELDVTVNVANVRTATREPIDYGMEPQRGLFVVVDVAVEVAAGGSGSYHVNPFNFKIVAADGSAMESSWAMAWEPLLQAVDLSAGQRTAGTVVFDVAPGQEVGARIQLDDIGANWGEPFVFWQL
jgi:Domain of unknown function (DUF4352)